MQTILFQGDSITDVGRNADAALWGEFGFGYPLLVSAKLGLAHPDAYRFVNRGVSGNRVVDLYARIKRDVINLRPDVLSILIGVNDVWHELGDRNGVDADKFERIYLMLIEEIRAALPDIRILILEPFVTHGPATDDRWDVFYGEVRLRAAAAKRVADRFALTFVPLQSVFDAALDRADASHWTVDGVHPTAFGHALIAQEWLNAFEK
ncbi:MAG: SGNH/GDSL hydrolase family protein [Clostridia bacterium]|nr:SGNH/GDSL hydrolase family protein [Clostridia bacterium]